MIAVVAVEVAMVVEDCVEDVASKEATSGMDNCCWGVIPGDGRVEGTLLPLETATTAGGGSTTPLFVAVGAYC